MTSRSAPSPIRRKRVRAWFGPHLICEHSAADRQARAYADLMPYRFHGLSVTISDAADDESLPPLPPERLWPLTVR